MKFTIQDYEADLVRIFSKTEKRYHVTLQDPDGAYIKEPIFIKTTTETPTLAEVTTLLDGIIGKDMLANPNRVKREPKAVVVEAEIVQDWGTLSGR